MKLSLSRSLLVSGVAVLGLAVALPSAFARGPGFGPGGGQRGARMAETLGLDEAQVTALQTLRDKHQAEMKPLREQAQQKREALAALWKAPKLDRAKLIAVTQELSATRTALELKRIDHLLSLNGVLTPEQFQKFVANQGPRGERGMRGHRGGGKRGHRGGMRGGFGGGGEGGPGFGMGPGGPACDGMGPGPFAPGADVDGEVDGE